MVVREKKRPLEPVVFLRGDAGSPGEAVPRRFLKVLTPEQPEFPDDSSGRLELADAIVDPANPLTPRVFVNRVWGYLMGSHLVSTSSDFGLQGEYPSHPLLLDWLAIRFSQRDAWSVKKLHRLIASSRLFREVLDTFARDYSLPSEPLIPETKL